MAAVASKPSISGIWMSISTTSNGPAATAATASRPFTAVATRQSIRASMRRATF